MSVVSLLCQLTGTSKAIEDGVLDDAQVSAGDLALGVALLRFCCHGFDSVRVDLLPSLY